VQSRFFSLLRMLLALSATAFVGTAMATPLPVSSCTGNFAAFTGVCTIYEEPSNPEQQDFNLGTPNLGTGIVDIYDPNGTTLSDSLDFYLNADGNIHLLFQSDSFAQAGGQASVTFNEDAAGNWCYGCGKGSNVVMGVSLP